VAKRCRSGSVAAGPINVILCGLRLLAALVLLASVPCARFNSEMGNLGEVRQSVSIVRISLVRRHTRAALGCRASIQIAGKAPPAFPIDAPQALRLAQEPLADVGRYDALRDGGLRHAS
jgi:hypothetical protein